MYRSEEEQGQFKGITMNYASLDLERCVKGNIIFMVVFNSTIACTMYRMIDNCLVMLITNMNIIGIVIKLKAF